MCVCVNGAAPAKFSCRVPDGFICSLPRGANPIYVLEIFAVLLAVNVLEDRFSSLCAGQGAVFLVDNNASLSAMVRASASTEPAAGAIYSAWQGFARLGLEPWFERVSSKLNMADVPSRCVAGHVLVGFPKPVPVLEL